MSVLSRSLDLDRELRVEYGAGNGLLERIALVLASTPVLDEALQRMAEIGREALGARRASILLLDRDRLVPAAASAVHTTDDELRAAYQAMEPVRLTDDHWSFLLRGRPVAFSDARGTNVVPPRWVDRFDLRSVAFVPVLAHGEPCGVLVVDWAAVRVVPHDELAVLEAMGVYAGLAVNNARLHERTVARSRAMQHLMSVAGAVNSSVSLAQVLEHVCGAFEEVLETSHCSVNLADPADPLRMQTLASRGRGWFTRNGVPVAPEVLLPVEEIRGTKAGPIVYSNLSLLGVDADDRTPMRSAVLFPLFGSDGLIGSVVTGYLTRSGPNAEDLEAGQALAEMTAAAIGRAGLQGELTQRVRQLETLAHLSDSVTATASVDEVVAGVNAALAPELGTRIDTVVVVDDGIRKAVGGAFPSSVEQAVLASWSASAAAGQGLGLRSTGGTLLVPVAYGRRLLGALRVVVDDDEVGFSDEEFLLAIGNAFAELLHRTTLHQTLEEAQRRSTGSTHDPPR